jgi:acetylornithine deacetylase
VGQNSAGDYHNRLPNRAVLKGTRRHDVGETLPGVADELRATVAGVERSTGATIRLSVDSISEAFEVDADSVIVQSLLAAEAELTDVEMKIVRTPVATNAAHFVGEAGIPAVCYGPDHDTNHSDREVLPLAELARLAAGFAIASARWFEVGGEGA